MSTSSVPDLAAGATGVLTPKFPLLRLFTMTPPQQQLPSSPTMRPSEKLLRDALLRDERERQQQLSGGNPPVTPPTHRRRHSYVPTSSYSASASAREEHTGGSFLSRTTMSNPRSCSRSSLSQGKELERDGGNSPVNRILFHGGDVEHQSQVHQQQQQNTTPYRYHVRPSSPSTSPSPSRRSSASTSPSPSPLHMKKRQETLSRPNTHTNNTHTNTPTTNGIPRNLSLQNTTPNRYASAYPSQRLGEPTQMTPHEKALRASLERVLMASGESNNGNSRMVGGRDGGDENEVRDEQGGWPWRRTRKSTGGRSGSGSILSFNTAITNSSSASNSTSNSSPSQLNYPHIPQIQSRTSYPTSTPNRTTRNPTGNNQRGPYYSPSSPRTPFSAPGGGVPTGYSPSPSHTRTRSQTDPNPHPPLSHPNTNPNPSPPSSKPTKESGGAMTPPLPLLLRNDAGTGAAEEELRLLTPPPTPPFMARIPVGDYAPSPYKTATRNGSSTPTRIPVRTQTQNTQRKKEAGLEMRRPTQGPAAGYIEKGKEQEPLRPLDFPSASSRQRGGQRQRDVTVTQQSQVRLATITTTGLNPDPKTVNTDGHSLASTESCSARTSGSSASPHTHSYIECASAPGLCACCSHSSLDGPLGSPPPPFVGGDNVCAHSPHRTFRRSSQSNPDLSPSSPTSTNNPFNARKASTQCRAIEGYVSFSSVEGLGEPPLMGDEFDGDGFGEGNGGGKGRVGATFLPLGVWTAALGWKRFLGGAGAGSGIGVEGQEQGVVV